MVELVANSGDPDQTHSAASDLGLHCLPVVSSLQWVNHSKPVTICMICRTPDKRGIH